MDITPLISEEKKVIKGYGGGQFVFANEEVWQSNVIVLPDLVSKWSAASYDSITCDSLNVITDQTHAIEVLLIGSGQEHKPLDPSLYQALKAHNIIAESMTTGAACRTYNVLLGEGRHVAAALLVI